MFQRHLLNQILTAYSDTPVLFIAGARQTGKSTLTKIIAEQHVSATYFTLDDLTVFSAAKNNPEGFVRGLPERSVIDEIQKAPELIVPIKKLVDEQRRPGRFLLTGSANIFVLPQLSESLAGRMAVFTLRPFSRGELLGCPETFIDRIFNNTGLSDNSDEDPTAIRDALLAGGYPEAVARTTAERRNAWFENYVQTIIQKDIRDLANIEALTQMPDLLRLIATRTGCLVDIADLSRSLQIPQTTLRRYLALFEATHLSFRIPAWHVNLGTRISKTPKMYIHDTGLAAWLLGFDTNRLSMDNTMRGRLFETFVVNELLKMSSWSSVKPSFYHFRSHSGQEVDIILEDRSGRCIGVEIKSGSTVGPSDCRGLQFLEQHLGERFVRGIIIYAGNTVVPFTEKIHAVPIQCACT